ncbi:MAG: sodium:solute symporter family protein [Dehalococcoidia bacterium]|nr:sodium:solute symporter family protein [Dehalococcoidia bacterium]
MSIIDLVVVIAYFVFILIVGLISYKKIKNEEDYSLAGRSLGYPFTIGLIIATVLGAGATMGTTGLSYNMGIGALWWVIAYAIGMIGFAFVAYVIRRIKYWTLPEVLQARFGNVARLIAAFTMILGLIALFGVQVAALGSVFTAMGNLYGITYETAIIIAGAIMIAYTIAGGMFALAYTEFIQASILLIVLGIVLPIILFSDIPVSTVITTLPDSMVNFWGGVQVAILVGWFLTLIPFSFVDVSLWQRASSAKSERVAKRSIFISTALFIGYSIVMVAVGMTGFFLYPNLVQEYGTSDVVLPVLILNKLPTVMIGFSIAAILAVVMSTAGSILMVSGMTVSRDIARYFAPTLSDKSALVTSRLTIFLIGAFGIIFALLMRGIFDMMLLAFALYVGVAFVPAMAALFWNKATKAGAIASMIGGGLTVIPLYALNKPFNIEPIFVALVISTILMVAVSLITYKEGVTTKKLSQQE